MEFAIPGAASGRRPYQRPGLSRARTRNAEAGRFGAHRLRRRFQDVRLAGRGREPDVAASRGPAHRRRHAGLPGRLTSNASGPLYGTREIAALTDRLIATKPDMALVMLGDVAHDSATIAKRNGLAPDAPRADGLGRHWGIWNRAERFFGLLFLNSIGLLSDVQTKEADNAWVSGFEEPVARHRHAPQGRGAARRAHPVRRAARRRCAGPPASPRCICPGAR